MAFIYMKEDSDPAFNSYAILDTNDGETNYYTKEDIIKFQTDPYFAKQLGIVIDGLPQDLKIAERSKNLHSARKEKNDEFYTQLSDIEKELMNYDPAIFKDKVIYCPTDVAYAQGRILPSEFVHYFQMNVKRLGFKKLIATCLAEKVDNNERIFNKYILERKLNPNYTEASAKYYSEDLPDEINYCDPETGDYIRVSDAFYLGVLDENTLPNNDGFREQIIKDAKFYRAERARLEAGTDDTFNSKYVIEVTLSQCEPDLGGGYGSGDFRSQECVNILKKSDIVVTNPPFSLFREFMAWFEPYLDTKKLIVIGNQNAITYKEFFPLIRDNKIRIGSQTGCKAMSFVDAQNDGYKEFGNICWFTNVDISKHHEKMLLTERYYESDGTTPLPESELIYPKFDNYDAINIDKLKLIPKDYYGVMGVPITFLYKHSFEQFEIITMSTMSGRSANYWSMVNGKPKYSRVFIKRKVGN